MNYGQKEVLKMLKRRKKAGITAWDALNKLGIFRLGARILELRQMGHDIETIHETGQNRRGHRVRYARYVLR
jgi:hypothetical protein